MDATDSYRVFLRVIDAHLPHEEAKYRQLTGFHFDDVGYRSNGDILLVIHFLPLSPFVD